MQVVAFGSRPALKTSNYLEITEDLVKAGKLPHLRHVIRLGREICHARKPDCPGCELRAICPSAGKFA